MRRVNPLVALGTHLLFERLGISLEPEREKSSVPELAEVPVIRNLQHKAGAVILILGRRESGKTVLSHRLAEVIGRPTYAVSPEQTPPKWIKELRLEELAEKPPAYSTLIVDDLPVMMSSRDYNNPLVQVLERIIPVVRHHRKIILIFSSQSSSMSDRYVMDSDIILLKPANLLFSDLERPAVAKLYKGVMPIFEKMSEGQQQKHAFIFSQGYRGLVSINLPRNHP